MNYLLDVNALVALGFGHHEFHARMAAWMAAWMASRMAAWMASRMQVEKRAPLATCSITELGFVRVLAQAKGYGLSAVQARTLLLRLKKSRGLSHSFLADDHDISHLPAWVKTPRQTTDGHLLQLARAHDAEFATLDENIPGAYVIPRV